MSVQDIGNLQDYILNGDNYTRIDPATGNTLVIPGQYGRPPLAPDIDKDTYRPINGDCPAGNCAIIAHDFFTKAYVILKIAGWNPSVEDCQCALAGMFLQQPEDPCIAANQRFVDASDGQILFDVIPAWYLAELGLVAPTIFTAVVAFDFWFVACYGGLITIPNLPNQLTSTCPPPGRIQLVNGQAVCFFDPPIPSNLPRHLTSKFGPSTRPRASGGQISRLSKIQRLINPTLNAGRPVMIDCGCGPNAVKPFEEELL